MEDNSASIAGNIGQFGSASLAGERRLYYALADAIEASLVRTAEQWRDDER